MYYTSSILRNPPKTPVLTIKAPRYITHLQFGAAISANRTSKRETMAECTNLQPKRRLRFATAQKRQNSQDGAPKKTVSVDIIS